MNICIYSYPYIFTHIYTHIFMYKTSSFKKIEFNSMHLQSNTTFVCMHVCGEGLMCVSKTSSDRHLEEFLQPSGCIYKDKTVINENIQI